MVRSDTTKPSRLRVIDCNLHDCSNYFGIITGPYNLKNPQDWVTERLIAIRKRRNGNSDADEDGGGSEYPRKSRKVRNDNWDRNEA